MHHPKSAFTKVKDAASMALKVLVDQAVDDEAFWGALTNDTTHPVLEYLRQLPTAAEGERPVKGGSYNDLAVFGDCWNDYLGNPKAKIISVYRAEESKTAASSAGPQPPAPSGSVVGGASAVKQGGDKVNAVAETKLKEKQKEKEHEKEKEKKDKAKEKDKDKGLDKGKGKQKQKQKQKRGSEGQGQGREVAKKKKVSHSALESESASESEKETSRPKPKPRMVHPATSVAKDVAAPVEATPAAKPKAKNAAVPDKAAGSAPGASAPAGDIGTLGIENLAMNNLTKKYGKTCAKVNEVSAAVDTLVLGLAGFRAFLEGIEARMGESGPEFVTATEALVTKTVEILESRQKMAEALEDMQQGDEDDKDEDEELKNAMRSHVKTVDSVYETLNNACRASNANTQALQYTIAGLVAFMRLSCSHRRHCLHQR
ncbi:hypothetical protein FA13DRAFT_1707072 [Coprinellus micaceus]|uniref:Uncharacterized protein n=1 Tax=Coprinellus micaceus TaxID=71717 RepID=A0A4Y7TMR4_COPMI|nr:hypothetical protein FA13DRAFT_1707072 [Coprinellus micaceus]